MLELLISAAIAVILWLRLRSVEAENRGLKLDLAAVREEVQAVRKAFLRRISALENAAPAPPPQPERESAPAEEPAPESPSPDPAPAPTTADVPPPAPAPQPPRGKPVRIDWEQWVGVRGAALLGAALLSLAGLLFLKYSIERGFLSPQVRIVLGSLAGIGLVAGSEWIHRKRYVQQANTIAGGGIVVLYAAAWAAHVVYGFIGGGASFALMALITLTCGYLSQRRRALSTALLGLTGGFLTPLLLSTVEDRPITLFSYLLLLNIGVYALSRARDWPLVSALAMAASVLYQTFWILTRMGAGRSGLGLAILGVFAAFYFLTALGQSHRKPGALEKLTGAAGIAATLALTAHFASSAELSPHLFPLAALLALLSLASVRLGREPGMETLPFLAAAADVGILTAWTAQTTFDTARSWEFALTAIVLAAAFHGPWEWFRRSAGGAAQHSLGIPALCGAGGLVLLLIPLQSYRSPPALAAWLTALTVLSLLLIRQDYLRGSVRGAWAAALAGGAGFAVAVAHLPFDNDPPRRLYILGLIYSAAMLLPGSLAADRSRQKALLRAGALAPAVLLMGLFSRANDPYLPELFFLTIALILGVLLAIAAEQLENGVVLLAAAFLVAAVHWSWPIMQPRYVSNGGPLLLAFAGVLLFTAWPLLFARLRENRWALRASALAGPLWFGAAYSFFKGAFGEDYPAFLPLALGAVSTAALYVFRNFPNVSSAVRQHGTVWYAAAALSFAAVAVPLQLQKEWVTIGWALQGAALIQLWRKLDHPGLKYFALSLSTLAAFRLLLPDAWAFHPRSGLPVLNWLMYAYLVPAAALTASAAGLRATEVERARKTESALYRAGRPLGAGLCGLLAVLVTFIWINLTVLDVFSSGRTLGLDFERTAARDLTLSLAWAVYALVLLAAGLRMRIRPLRWVSLFFLLATILKVFLYDLGELEDLYRVGSLLGLAVSLILVSFAYQRFVFGHSQD